jgi:DNA-binding transcriptional LysR family regulator
VACVPSFASQILPSLLQVFTSAHPDVRISVEDDTADHVHQRVLHRHVDFGVASMWNLDPNLSFEPLLKDPMGLVCRRDHPLANLDRPLDWRDLQGESLITNGTVRLLDGTPARSVMEHAHLSVSNVISLLALLRAGIGVTALPRLALDERDPDLCFIPLAEPLIERSIGLLAPKRYSLSPAAQALYEATRAHAAELDAGTAANVDSAPAAAH